MRVIEENNWGYAPRLGNPLPARSRYNAVRAKSTGRFPGRPTENSNGHTIPTKRYRRKSNHFDRNPDFANEQLQQKPTGEPL